MRRQTGLLASILAGQPRILESQPVQSFNEQEKSLIILPLLTQLFGTVVLPSSKDKSEVFLPSPCQAILCRCSSYLQETTNTPDKWGEVGRVEIVFLSKVPLL